jgi:hypothetical protein
MNFEELYKNSPENIKLKFLDAKIKHDKDLQKEFMAYAESEKKQLPGNSINDFLEIIRTTRKKYKMLLEAVDLENPDWENYHAPHSAYIEEWEAYQQAGEQEFDTIFTGFYSAAMDKIIGQKMDELVAMLIGLFYATQDAEIQDSYDSFEDVNEYLSEVHEEKMNQLIEKLKLSAVPGSRATNAIELFVSYFTGEKADKSTDPEYFEHLLIALAEKSEDPVRILDMINTSPLDSDSFAELKLLLLSKSGDKTAWLKTAELYYKNNNEVARQLLQYYFKSDKQAFMRVAHEVFQTNKSEWAKFLQNYLTPQLDKSLFLNVFWRLTTDERQISHYNKIRNLLSEEEINRLLAEVKADKPFKVQILSEEQRYAEIQNMVKNESDDWHYDKIIEPILTIYPQFCFENIRNRIQKTLLDQRGRSVYERIVCWIQLTKQIPGFEQEKQILIKETFNHKPNLPALRDEMKKAKLV